MRVNNNFLVWLLHRRKKVEVDIDYFNKKIFETNIIMLLGFLTIMLFYFLDIRLSIFFFTLSFSQFSVMFVLSFLLLAWRYNRLTTLHGFTTMSGEYESKHKYFNSVTYFLRLLGSDISFYEVDGELLGEDVDVWFHRTKASKPLYVICVIMATVDWMINPLWSFHKIGKSNVEYVCDEKVWESIKGGK